MQKTALKIPSAGGGLLHTVAVSPNETPKAMIQFVHGMAEYVERYRTTMEFLAENGFLCFGHDHFGHGYSVMHEEELGHLPYKSGKDVMVQDTITVTEVYKSQYPDIPCILFGHSMGSFVVRCAAAKRGNLYDGLIVCGTGGPNPALGAGKLVSAIMKTLKGEWNHSPLMYALMFGGYNKRFDDNSKFAWLNSAADEVNLYGNDPLCGFPFTIGGLRSLLNALGEANAKTTFQNTPKDLPVLLIAGAEDPVGNFGNGVKTVEALYKKAGVKVTCRLYDGMRHEILNEPKKQLVLDDMTAFIDEII